jgi:hypothetical protein
MVVLGSKIDSINSKIDSLASSIEKRLDNQDEKNTNSARAQKLNFQELEIKLRKKHAPTKLPDQPDK